MAAVFNTSGDVAMRPIDIHVQRITLAICRLANIVITELPSLWQDPRASPNWSLGVGGARAPLECLGSAGTAAALVAFTDRLLARVTSALHLRQAATAPALATRQWFYQQDLELWIRVRISVMLLACEVGDRNHW